jgi:hypothetical protein
MPKSTPKPEIDVAEVLEYMRMTGTFAQVLSEVVKRRMTAQAAKDQGISVSVKELQKAADDFRVDRGLHKASDTQSWLQSNRLSVGAFERYLETNLLISKFKDFLEARARRSKYTPSRTAKNNLRELVYQDWLVRAVRQPPPK